MKEKVFIVEERDNPSTDYFILPQFSSSEYEIHKFNFNELPDAFQLKNSIVVFVRYAPPKWRKLIAQNRALFKALYFFMDDDLFDLSATHGQPLKYRWKLFKLSYRNQAWLKKHKVKLWVSTWYLVNKYSNWQPVMIQPQFLYSQLDSINAYQAQNKSLTDVQLKNNPVTIFYHGSASHHAEAEWLVPIIRAVLQQCSNSRFEIIGTKKVSKLFQGIPRVDVLPPMSWNRYQSLIIKPGRHIGLAPLLDSAFNAARSHTKVFDIQAAKAIGFYAQNSESARFTIENNIEKSFVLPMEQDVWAEKLIEVTRNIMAEKLNDQ